MTNVDQPTHRDLRAVRPAPLADSPGVVPVAAGYGTGGPSLGLPPFDEDANTWGENDEPTERDWVEGGAQGVNDHADAVERVPAAVAPSSPHLSHLADVLHTIACGCPVGDDVEGHGIDFEALADSVRAGVLDEAGVPEGRAPVEAKVWAGTWGSLAATTGLALVTLLLDRLDVIPTLFAGDYPWVGGLVLVLGVVLPPIAQFIRAYLAEHTVRPADVAAGGLNPRGQGPSTPIAPTAI